jgi:hypothetical protein
MNPGGLFVSSSGLVGIGNIIPAYTLDVSGTGRFTSTLLVSGNTSIGTTNSSVRLNVQAAANFETPTLGTATGTMGYLAANGLYGMYIGIGNSGNTWLQSQRNDGTTSAYNLLLNPSGGNVGIGTTPSYMLDILSTQSNALRVYQNINNDNYVRIDNTSTGTSATSRVDIGVNANSYSLTIQRFGLNFVGTLFGVSCTNSSAIYDNAASSNALFIGAVSSTPIIFGTSNTERMRITSGGNVLVGGTDVANLGTSNRIGAFRVDSAGEVYLQLATTGQSTVNHAFFYNSTGLGGSIRTSSGTISLVNGSDYRMKTNIESLTEGLSIISKLKPCTFEYIATEGSKFEGFIAHELQEIIPNAVFGEKDAINEDGTPDYQGVDTVKIIPYLVKAIQELKAEIEELKNK